jgi:hypothetical protein
MRNLSKKAKTIIAGAAIAGLASAGGAYAYWTSIGEGTGTAGTAASALNLVISGDPAAGIKPGGSVVVPVIVNNPNSFKVNVGTVSASITTSDGQCIPADFHFTLGPVNALITTGNHAYTGSLSMDDTTVNQDACKNAIITLTYSSTSS